MIDQSVRKDMLITFSTAFVLIVYEVFLSRFFSVILDYNFVFLAISLATLGIGTGGFIAYKSAGGIYRFRSEWLGIYSLVITLIVFVMYVLPFSGIWFYSAVALLPFLAGGMILAAVMQGQHDQIRAIYFSDLTGAGIGAVCSIWLMNVFNPIQAICLISAVLLLLSFLFSIKNVSKPLKAVYFIMLIFVVYNIIQPYSKEISFLAYTTSPNNVFQNEKESQPVFSEWNSFAKTDVYDAGDGQLLYITIDGGAVSPISNYSGDLKQVDYLKNTTSFLAFQNISKERALIIGAGGGQEVLTAQIAGFKLIDAVDINAGSFKAVKEMSAFSGNVFNQPGVSAIVSDGRNFIRKTKNLYDIIYLSLVKKESENGLGIAMTENYIFTQEAIGEYFKKLKPGGKLAFLLHDETELIKVKAAAQKVLHDQGISDDQFNNHMVVIGTYQHLGHVVWGMNGTTITRPLLMISAQPLSMTTAQRLKTDAESIQQIPLHIPYVLDRLDILMDSLTLKKVDLSTNRDDKPFFYNKTIGVPHPFIWLLVLILLISYMLIRRTHYTYGRAAYFSGIAIGFIIIETTLVQRLILALGHPTLSFVMVLGVLLVSGGMGSLVSTRWFSGGTKRYTPLFCVAFLTIGINLVITWYHEQMFYLPLVYRLIIAGLLLIPLGFFMGMPFPFGLTLIPKQQTAISWAINGLMTVAGSLISIMISLTMGFTVALVIGACIYGLLFIVQPKLNMQVS
ncbi:MAG: spermine synthase [Candidatus Pristimantibacillus sp.]